MAVGPNTMSESVKLPLVFVLLTTTYVCPAMLSPIAALKVPWARSMSTGRLVLVFVPLMKVTKNGDGSSEA